MTPTLTRDLPCIDCGYNLRGLDPAAARCPECGAPAAQSLDRQFFRDADPTWVRRTGRALQLLPLAGVIWCGLALFAGWILPAVESGRPLADRSLALLAAIPPGPRPLGLAAAVVVPAVIDLRQAACLLLGVAFYVWTLFRLTADPGADGHRAFLSPRQLLRYAAALYAGAAAVFAYVAFDYRDALTGGELAPVALGFLAIDALIVPLLYCHLADLALRIPNKRLARRARWLMWAWITLDLCVAAPLLFYALNLPTRAALEPAAITMLLTAFLTVPLSFLFNVHFATAWRSALTARQFWARSHRPPAALNPEP